MNERILVVDDDPAMLRTVGRVLSSRYEVTTAATPAAAQALVTEFEPALAIVDIRMPEMDGFELVTELRALRPEIDVIFMTGIVHELDAKVIRSIRERAFYFIQKPFDREVLLTLIERCFELRKLAGENKQYVRRLEDDLTEARRFQQGLFPAASTSVAGVTITGHCDSCDTLGGDFFDYAQVSASCAALLLADVSGHGSSAAMLTGIVKVAFDSAHADDYEPRSVVEHMATALESFDVSRFVTVFCARIWRDTQEIEYVNAGHPAALVAGYRTDATPTTIVELDSTGPVVSSAFRDVGWESRRVELPIGSKLIVYSDGVTEAFGEDGEFFGETRLVEAVRRSPSRGTELITEILDAVHRHAGGRPPDDDLTLLTAALC